MATLHGQAAKLAGPPPTMLPGEALADPAAASSAARTSTTAIRRIALHLSTVKSVHDTIAAAQRGSIRAHSAFGSAVCHRGPAAIRPLPRGRDLAQCGPAAAGALFRGGIPRQARRDDPV